MAPDPDNFEYTPYSGTFTGHHRKDAVMLWPMIAQPVALVVVIVTYCYDAVYNPRPWSNSYRPIDPTPSYGLIWLCITGLPLAAALLWYLVGYIEHWQIETKEKQAWPAKVAARRAAEAHQLRLQQEAERAEASAKREAQAMEELRKRMLRVGELDNVVLTINANIAATVDFFGNADPAAFHPDVRHALLTLTIPDLWLLHETQNEAVRRIIGDGAFLPREPLRLSPLLTPSTTPLKPPSLAR